MTAVEFILFRSLSHQYDANNKTENLNQYFKEYEVHLVPWHALKVLQLLVFRSNCPEVTELRPDLQRAGAVLLLVIFPSLPRTHLKFAYSAMLHKVPSSRRKCLHDIIAIPAVLILKRMAETFRIEKLVKQYESS